MPDKTDPKQINVEIDMVTTDVHEIQVITIPFDMYNSLIEIKGRYEEIKDGEEDNEVFMKEYQELLVIKGKYIELSNMFENQESTIAPKSESPAVRLNTNFAKKEDPENPIRITEEG